MATSTYKVKSGNTEDLPSVATNDYGELLFAKDDKILYITDSSGTLVELMKESIPYFPEDNMILHYTYDDIRGSVVMDEMSTYNGNLINYYFGAGKHGNSIKYDVNSNIQITNTLALTTDATLSSWFNFERDDFSTYLYYNNKFHISLDLVTGIISVTYNSNTIAGTVDLGCVVDTWYNITFTMSGADVKVYLDGVLTDTITIGETFDLSGITGTIIGCPIINGFVEYKQDTTRIFDAVISDEYIALLATEL